MGNIYKKYCQRLVDTLPSYYCTNKGNEKRFNKNYMNQFCILSTIIGNEGRIYKTTLQTSKFFNEYFGFIYLS